MRWRLLFVGVVVLDTCSGTDSSEWWQAMGNSLATTVNLTH